MALQLRSALSLQGLQPSLGVASGQCVVGPVGGAMRQEWTCHGNRVILAARLMQLATKHGGMVLCDEPTHAATCDEMRFVKLNPVALKGQPRPVTPYRPVASSELLELPALRARPREGGYFESAAASRVLKRCVAWAEAESPSFMGIAISGERGVGKTELLMQVRAALEPRRNCRLLQIRCRSHEQGELGALLRRLFAQLCGCDVLPTLQRLIPVLCKKNHPPIKEKTPPSMGGEEAGPLVEKRPPEAQLRRSAALEMERERQLVDDELETLCKLASAEVSSVGATSAGVRGHSQPSESPTDAEGEDDGERGGGRGGGGLVLLIDHVHDADAHSTKLLRALVRTRAMPVLLVVAGRPHARGSDSGEHEKSRDSPGQQLLDELGQMAQAAAGGSLEAGGLSLGEGGVSLGEEGVSLGEEGGSEALTGVSDEITADEEPRSHGDLHAAVLAPLDTKASEQLACALTGRRTIEPQVLELMARRSGGNPLLCEAIVTCLLNAPNGATHHEGNHEGHYEGRDHQGAACAHSHVAVGGVYPSLHPSPPPPRGRPFTVAFAVAPQRSHTPPEPHHWRGLARHPPDRLHASL